ncbi:MAG: CRISPR system precrRNA processing endoribonuclease RAMP protein Cas6 [Lentisphaerae bacterium]|nr:CRISPR system precrRNA processing endoribonuclease RAMP protein Cas6 [Lentisphaerota bacterium]
MFAIQKLRYELRAGEPIIMHELVPTVTLRGAFGYAIAQLIARYDGIAHMAEKVQIYRQLFMPERQDGLATVHRDIPRPFLLRGAYSRPDRRSFLLEVILWGSAIPFEPFVDQVVELVAIMGIGRRNVCCDHQKIVSEAVATTFPAAVCQLQVDFLSPVVRLACNGRPLRDSVPFYALFARFLDRFSEIDRVYGEGYGVPDEEAYELKQWARSIHSHVIALEQVATQRRSTRSKQTMELRGFVGSMQYLGDFDPARKYLGYLPWIHVGHCSTFGCGWTTLHCSSYQHMRETS